MPSPSRRTLLQTLAGAGIALAGCQSDSEPTTTRTDTATPTTTETATETNTETDTPTEEPDPGALGGDFDALPELAWPLPDRGPSNSAYLPAGPEFTEAPDVGWELDPTNPDEDHYSPRYLQPVIAGDTVYAVNALTYGTNVARPDEQYLHAVSTTGERSWEVPLSAGDSTPVPSAPAIDDGSVLVGLDQELHAYDRSTGDTAWTVDIGDGVNTVVPTAQRVVVRAHRAIVAVADGDEQWTVPYEMYPSAMAVRPETVFVGASKRISALEPATGEIRWREDLPAVTNGWGVSSLVAVPGGVLARQNSGHVYAYTDDGVEVWRTRGLDYAVATDGTSLYASTTGSIRSLDVANGELGWERTCGEIPNCPGASDVLDIVATDDSVIAALEDGVVVGLDAQTGSVRWTTRAPITVEGLAGDGTAIYGVGGRDDPLVQLTA